MARSVLTDDMWNKIEPLLPPLGGYWGRPYKPHRKIVEGILWILKTGSPWRELSPEYGPWKTCYTRFNRWSKKGIWQEVCNALKDDIDNENYSVDSSHIKAHQDACRVKNQKEECLGTSRGGITSKIHALTDGLGRCVKFILTPGQVHDSKQMIPLLEGETCENVLADKAYDTDEIRDYIRNMGANAVIPPKKNRSQPIDYDKHIYKERHLVEIFFQFIKRFRRIGTRYEKHAQNFSAMVTIGCILHWCIF